MAAEPPAALLPIAMAMLLPLVLLLVVMRELRVLLQCAAQTWRAVHRQQVAVRQLLEIGLLRWLRALLAPHLLQVRRLQVHALQCWVCVCLRMVAVHSLVGQWRVRHVIVQCLGWWSCARRAAAVCL